MVQATQEYYLARVAELEKQLDLVQKELVLGMESLEAKVRELEQELKWKSARVMALELDLERAREKLMWKE
jgi:chromosome segregation ATPase